MNGHGTGAEQAATQQELEQVLTDRSLTAEQREYYSAHLSLVTALSGLPKERMPETLRKRLYALEQPSAGKRLIMAGTDVLRPALLVAGGVAAVVVMNNSDVPFHIFLFATGVLSVIFGALVYDLFRSHFFSL